MSIFSRIFWCLFQTWFVASICNHGVSWLRRNEVQAERAECLEEINAFSYQVDQALENKNWDEVLNTLYKMNGEYVLPYHLRAALYYAATAGNLPVVVQLVEGFPIQSCAYLQMALRQAQKNGHGNVASYLKERSDKILGR